MKLFFPAVLLALACGGRTEEEPAVAGQSGGSGPSTSGTAGRAGAGGRASTTGGTSATGTAGGTSATGATGGTSGYGAQGGVGGDGAGIPLTPSEGGWVDGSSNTIGVQGAMFAAADATTLATMAGECTTCGGAPITFMEGGACIRGEAAKVDLNCTPVAPAVDCYGNYWGALIGLNLNQPIDPTTMMADLPLPYDGSALKGFAFQISGTTIPTSLRFKVEDASGEFCTGAMTPIFGGVNVVTFTELTENCWIAGGATAETAKAGLLRIAWQVVTNATSTVPFDFCVSNVLALY